MWKSLFDKDKEELKQMLFSKQAIKKIVQMKKIVFDKKITAFLQQCLLTNYVQLSIRFSNVYNTFEDFIKRIQGKRINKNKFISFMIFL